MHIIPRTIAGRLSSLLIVTTLSACGWVDSTGVQGSTVPITLRNAQPVALLEEVALTALLAGEGADLQNWTWSPDDADITDRCGEIEGFDTALSSHSLDDACSIDGDCVLALEESRIGSATRFTLRMPALRSPVALNFRLRATRDDGAIVERQQLLCGLSVNEAPQAENDSYLTLQGEILLVKPTDPNSLLANDHDDDDIRNSALRVARLVEAPRFAANFSLDDNGGFYYQSVANGSAVDAGNFRDSFVYAVTDGLHDVHATATIDIVSENRGPQRVQKIPDITVNAFSDDETPDTLVYDLTRYFVDPDGDTLVYSLAGEQQPGTDSIQLSPRGRLDILPSSADIGKYTLDLTVDDGLEDVSDSFEVIIAPPYSWADNQPPEVTDIRNQTVKDSFSYDVSVYFSDPDDDVLSFRADGLPQDVTITSSGIIRGESSEDNEGRWFIAVTADDGRGGTVTDRFRLVIK
ncbi:MAG: hypothetical protein HKN42_16330 [Granulosicoccus sp.]|nr:hypothetical protein [Granulosicoccus sp.]